MRKHLCCLTVLLGIIVLSGVVAGCKLGEKKGCGTDAPPAQPDPLPAPTAERDAEQDASRVNPGTGGLDPSDSDERPSRYMQDSQLWKHIKRVKPDSGQLDRVWFSWGDVHRIVETTVATALSTPWNRKVDPEEVRKTLCSATGRACDAKSLYERGNSERITIKALPEAAKIKENSRENAKTSCHRNVDKMIEDIEDQLKKVHGVIAVGYVEKAFDDSDDPGVAPSDVHPFTVIAADIKTGLLLVDSAEITPHVYRLSKEDMCGFFAAPLMNELEFAAGPSRNVSNWGVTVWTVEGSPPPPPSKGVLHLGRYAVPKSEPTKETVLNPGLVKPYTTLRIGINREDEQKNSAWFVALEENCSWKYRSANDLFRKCRGDVWAAFDNGQAKSSAMFLDPLVQLFHIGACTVKTDTAGQREWEIMSIIRYVQGLRHEIPTEYKLQLRPPIQVVYRQAGDCDSKSLLGAVMLQHLGYRTGVGELQRHAVLAVHVDDMPWLKDANTPSIKGPDNQQYYLTEMTDYWNPGMYPWERICKCKTEQAAKIKLIPRDAKALAPKQR